METKIESLRAQFAIHRNNLTDLECKRAQYGLEVPLHVKREIEQEETEMSRLEAEIRSVNDSLARKLNGIRDQVISCLDEYTQLSSKLSEFENLFLSHVLFPGFQLQQTIQKRKYLEREYNRIREAIERGIYNDPKEIDADIRQTLKHAEVAYAYKETEPSEAEQLDEGASAMSPTSTMGRAELDDEIDEAMKKKVIKEFKEIVLPKVHADTSDAPFEVFDAAYGAYKKRDYLLMEAFVIKYRGELHPPTEEPVVFLDQATKYSHEYPRVKEGLERRLDGLKEDTTTQRLENPEEVQMQLKKQNREIRRATYEEAEQILYLRSCLEDLVQLKPFE